MMGDGRMTPDERYEQAALAQMGARRNRPRHLVVLGATVLVVAMIVTIFAWTSQAGAARDLAKRETQLETLAELTAEWKVLSASEESADNIDRRFQQSRVRELATQAGMVNAPPLAQPRLDTYKDTRRARYRYSVSDKSLASLMTWVDLMLSEYRGVWVHEIEIKPSGDTWQMQVVFARWEQTST